MAKRPLTISLVEAAAEGREPLGLCAVSGSGTSKFTVIDADDDTTFLRLVDHLKGHPSANLLVEPSRRGGHVWFLWHSTCWQNAQAYGIELCRELDIRADIYPRHAGLNAVKCLGTRHPKSGLIYPALDVSTGEVMNALSALERIEPMACPQIELMELNVPPIPDDPSEFWELVQELSKLTKLRIYDHQRASGLCPFHPDKHPSLGVDGKRFRCFACGAWGDIFDVRRYIARQVLPPTG